MQRSEIDRAQRAHNCQASAKHRLGQGDRRLKVYEDRSHVHYCAECAIKIIQADIAKLLELAQQLQSAP